MGALSLDPTGDLRPPDPLGYSPAMKISVTATAFKVAPMTYMTLLMSNCRQPVPHDLKTTQAQNSNVEVTKSRMIFNVPTKTNKQQDIKNQKLLKRPTKNKIALST